VSWRSAWARPAYMVEGAADLQSGWFAQARRVGLTAGASAPDILVQQVIQRLRELGAVSIRKMEWCRGGCALSTAARPG
jgi:4-hydroxy-3-methylbut-2-enyl diphosphate reductase IspH